MKAYVYDSASKGSFGMSFRDVTSQKPLAFPTPALEKGEVLIQVRAAALNPVDYKLASLPIVGSLLQSKPVAQDMSGVVVESKSTKFPVGTSVFGFASGCIAEKAVAKETEVAMKPATLTYIQAAGLPTVTLTSLQALRLGGTKQGSNVLIAGASGGCGYSGVQIARALSGPTGKIGGICGSSNVEHLQSLGVCDVLLDYKNPSVILDESSSPLKSLAPLTVFYDTVSSPEAGDGLNGVSYDVALRPFLAPSAQTVAINGSAMRWFRMFLGWQERSFKMTLCKRNSADLETVARWCEERDESRSSAQGNGLGPVVLSVPVDSVHAFTSEGCKAAYDRLHSRRAVGKVVVDVLNGGEM